jgi:N-formylglutamate deformylase
MVTANDRAHGPDPPGSPAEPFTIELGDGPLVAVAIHDGHEVRPEVAALLALSGTERLREEDPFTRYWVDVASTRVVVHRSRFEVDLNRPRAAAVYQVPADAWGLEVWRAPPPRPLVERSLAQYDTFYAALERLLAGKIRRHGRCVVYDLHSYNHRREGPAAQPADPAANPQINVGTGSMDRALWAPVVERFLADLRASPVLGEPLDVRENVKFKGGALAAFVHRTFPETACALAIEVKKFFMDEWTGEPDLATIEAVRAALASAARGTRETLEAP